MTRTHQLEATLKALRLSGMALLPDWHDALARLVPALVAPGVR